MRIPLTPYGLREIAIGTVAFLLGVAIVGWLFWPAGVAMGLLWLGLLAFFRDPDRHIPDVPDALLSPADGTVWDVEVTDPPGDFLGEPALRIGIFMSLLNVHVNRSPVSGMVRWVQYFPGSSRDARSRSAALENEHNLVGIETREGRCVLVNQIAGMIARRVVCQAVVGQPVEAGERFGMVKFGSRVELFVPQRDKVDVKVQIGDKVRGGVDILAVFTA
ncbi:MAG: phosphatidylserine decarboxylase [Candidatus Brocadiia bacterium]